MKAASNLSDMRGADPDARKQYFGTLLLLEKIFFFVWPNKKNILL